MGRKEKYGKERQEADELHIQLEYHRRLLMCLYRVIKCKTTLHREQNNPIFCVYVYQLVSARVNSLQCTET